MAKCWGGGGYLRWTGGVKGEQHYFLWKPGYSPAVRATRLLQSVGLEQTVTLFITYSHFSEHAEVYAKNV